MFREFEATIIDDQGHFDMPRDVRERKGLTKGARVKIEERNSELVIKPAETEEERKNRQKAAIRSAIGILPPDSKVIEHLLEERKKEREKEDRPSGF